MDADKLVQKIVSVMRDVGAVPKTRINKFHGYSYRGHEDICNALQPALVRAGIIIIPTKRDLIDHRDGYIRILCTYCITDGVQSIEIVGIGEGIDISKDGKSGDKAAYKAQTGAIKYALCDLLMLGTEDPEEDDATHKTPGKQRPTVTGGVKPGTAPQRPTVTGGVKPGTAPQRPTLDAGVALPAPDIGDLGEPPLLLSDNPVEDWSAEIEQCDTRQKLLDLGGALGGSDLSHEQKKTLRGRWATRMLEITKGESHDDK